MANSILARKDDGTITLTITLSWKQVKKTWDEVVEQIVKETTLPGFRKGMAPREMVEKGVDRVKIQDEVLRKLLPEAYTEAVKEHKLQPVMSPKIRIEKLEDEKDWVFAADTAEAPKVDLGKYKDAVKKITTKSKIVIPGKEPEKPTTDEIIKTVVENATVTVPAILIETEAERQLSQLLDEVKSLGLSLDQYLASTHKTIEQVRAEYQERAQKDIAFEFVLSEIANQEKITVEQKELEEALAKAQSPEERKNLEQNIYLLASILRQQKTLEYLKSL